MNKWSRTDSNHQAIREYLEAHGCAVISTARAGIPGFPDLVVGFWQTSRVALVEVKSGKSKLHAKQEAFKQRFPVFVVRSDADAAGVVAFLKDKL